MVFHCIMLYHYCRFEENFPAFVKHFHFLIIVDMMLLVYILPTDLTMNHFLADFLGNISPSYSLWPQQSFSCLWLPNCIWSTKYQANMNLDYGDSIGVSIVNQHWNRIYIHIYIYIYTYTHTYICIYIYIYIYIIRLTMQIAPGKVDSVD